MIEQCLRNVQNYIQLPLLFEHWYIAGLSSEFSQKLTAKTLLERSIVFFRREDGTVGALQNRCAHRSYPLSESHRIGDGIQCGYHGIRYDGYGRIISVPCQERTPEAGVKCYDTFETGPFVWIWLGNGPGDPAKIPDMTPYVNNGWAFCEGTVSMDGNYLLMQENLADLSHLPFLHAKTFGVPESWAARSIEVKIDEATHTVDFFRRVNRWEEARAFFPPSYNFSGRNFTYRGGGDLFRQVSFGGGTGLMF